MINNLDEWSQMPGKTALAQVVYFSKAGIIGLYMHSPNLCSTVWLNSGGIGDWPRRLPAAI